MDGWQPVNVIKFKEQLSGAEIDHAGISEKMESIANRIDVVRREVVRANKEYRTCYEELVLDWRQKEGEDLSVGYGILGWTYNRNSERLLE